MRRLLRLVLAVAAVALLAPAAGGHFTMLLPEKASARKDEPVAFVYQFGHPFEHQLFDAPAPARLLVLAPDGKPTDLTRAVEKVQVPGPEKKPVTAYRFRFTPAARGDYTFLLHTPPIWLEEDEEFVQDTVKVVLHVQGQKGWDAEGGRELQMVPLTRPYGLQPGMVFQARVLAPAAAGKASALAGALVEVERYNAAPPAILPPDEHVTRTLRTDPNGVLTTTLPEAGWWSITAQRDGGQRMHKGKSYPVRQRVTLWVWVDEVLGRR